MRGLIRLTGSLRRDAACAVGKSRRVPVLSVAFGVLLVLFPGVLVTSCNEAPNVAIQKRIRSALAAKGPDYQPRTEHLDSDGSPLYTNRLILEDSPYLLQHAHNPVDWYAWGPEAFAKAQAENKPVFLSIGYSTCHWCHVMERESFENTEVAEFLNTHFVAIKVDRETRPDIDTVYMTAVQLMTGRGGWPMSSFLTPAGQTFFGGTYYPRTRFLALLHQIESTWRENRPGLEAQAGRVAEGVAAATRSADVAGELAGETVSSAVASLLRGHDQQRGGFGPAPKFPNEPHYLFLLDHALRTGDDTIRKLIEFDLSAMARGGIYDQVGGGFHRYSTDDRWLVPHFEKMLYNQAQLSRLYAQAWRLTGDAELARIARQTLDYVLRDMTSPEGAFYSATDADSPQGEGLFFVWTPAQLRETLSPSDAQLAIDLYGVTAGGNFENANILNLPLPLTEFARQRQMDMPALLARIEYIRTRLNAARHQRQRPDRDEKIVTAWNGMMIVALAEVAEILQEQRYRQAALRVAEFLWSNSRREEDKLWRVRLHGRSSEPAIQEDYAWLADGFIHLYDLTGETRWLERAELLAATMKELFWDDASGGYFMNARSQDVPMMVRPKDSIDNALPSGNAVAMQVLTKLAQRTGKDIYRRTANALLASFAVSINESPTGYGYFLSGSQLLRDGAAGPQHYAARGAVKVSARVQANALIVDLVIRDGWHIQANKPLQDELIPTVLALEETGSAWQGSPVSYPGAILKTLNFQGGELALYEGEVRFAMDIQQTNSRVIEPLVPLVLRLQACDDTVCLPPEQLVLRVPATRAP